MLFCFGTETGPMRTYAQWKADTDRRFRARGNHQMMSRVDTFLRGYWRGNLQVGDWATRAFPLSQFLGEMDQWLSNRANRGDFLFPHLSALWSEASEELRRLMVDVGQGRFQTVTGNLNPRYLSTTGALSCMVVILYDKVGHTASLGHLFAYQIIEQGGNHSAAANVHIMVTSFQLACGHAQMANVVGYVIGGRALSDQPRQGGGASKRQLLIDALTNEGVPAVNSGFTFVTPERALNVAFDREHGYPVFFDPAYQVAVTGLRPTMTDNEGPTLLEMPDIPPQWTPTRPWQD
jgi:chemotaxis receptor (MCP) glutamine deamidase CheD